MSEAFSFINFLRVVENLMVFLHESAQFSAQLERKVNTLINMSPRFGSVNFPLDSYPNSCNLIGDEFGYWVFASIWLLWLGEEGGGGCY